jgi:hypothetical protein
VNAQVLLREIRQRGYGGGYTILKDWLHPQRSAAYAAAVRRFETPPGKQAQVDWGHLGDPEVDGAAHRIWGFTITLGYSRRMWAQAALDQKLGTLLRMHEGAFQEWGGVPEEILYERMRTVWLGQDERGEIIWHPVFLDFARYWGFQPRLCRPYRAQTKGKIESGVKYVRRNFVCGLQGREPGCFPQGFDFAKAFGWILLAIDSAQPIGRQMFALTGIQAEQFLVGLRDKVYRGQEGRVLKGLNPGGKCYGYRNVPIEHLSKTMKYGRPAVLGVRLEIIDEQAEVVRRIFNMSTDGAGYGEIARQLNRDGVPGPRHKHWSRYSIFEMLRNERYHGIHVWGRTKKDRNPETGKKVAREAPSSGQRRVEVPEWRIVPEELWRAVQERRERVNASGIHRLGGMQRTERSRSYLLSGSLICGSCAGSMVICAGGGKRGYVKYGCHTRKQSGMCDNKLMIRQDRLEEQLLAAIEERLLNPPTLECAVKRCEEELRNRLAEMERQGSMTTVDSLSMRRQDLASRLARLIEAIEIGGGDLISLTQRLRDVEHEIMRLNETIAVHRPVKLDTAGDGVRDHVVKSIMRLGEMLKSEDMSRAKEAVAKHVGKLVLTPVEHDGRPVYKVSGSVSIQPPADTGKCRMQLVARDGIGTPTAVHST